MIPNEIILQKNDSLLYVRLSETQKEKLNVLADLLGSSMSQVARSAIADLLNRRKYDIKDHREELKRRKKELENLERE